MGIVFIASVGGGNEILVLRDQKECGCSDAPRARPALAANTRREHSTQDSKHTFPQRTFLPTKQFGSLGRISGV
jgi:hypothetical protein